MLLLKTRVKNLRDGKIIMKILEELKKNWKFYNINNIINDIYGKYFG